MTIQLNNIGMVIRLLLLLMVLAVTMPLRASLVVFAFTNSATGQLDTNAYRLTPYKNVRNADGTFNTVGPTVQYQNPTGYATNWLVNNFYMVTNPATGFWEMVLVPDNSSNLVYAGSISLGQNANPFVTLIVNTNMGGGGGTGTVTNGAYTLVGTNGAGATYANVDVPNLLGSQGVLTNGNTIGALIGSPLILSNPPNSYASYLILQGGNGAFGNFTNEIYANNSGLNIVDGYGGNTVGISAGSASFYGAVAAGSFSGSASGLTGPWPSPVVTNRSTFTGNLGTTTNTGTIFGGMLSGVAISGASSIASGGTLTVPNGGTIAFSAGSQTTGSIPGNGNGLTNIPGSGVNLNNVTVPTAWGTNAFSAVGSATYLQGNIQNTLNTGSSDWVATEDTGGPTNNYVDLFQNNSAYSASANGTLDSSNDAGIDFVNTNSGATYWIKSVATNGLIRMVTAAGGTTGVTNVTLYPAAASANSSNVLSGTTFGSFNGSHSGNGAGLTGLSSGSINNTFQTNVLLYPGSLGATNLPNSSYQLIQSNSMSDVGFKLEAVESRAYTGVVPWILLGSSVDFGTGVTNPWDSYPNQVFRQLPEAGRFLCCVGPQGSGGAPTNWGVAYSTGWTANVAAGLYGWQPCSFLNYSNSIPTATNQVLTFTFYGTNTYLWIASLQGAANPGFAQVSIDGAAGVNYLCTNMYWTNLNFVLPVLGWHTLSLQASNGFTEIGCAGLGVNWATNGVMLCDFGQPGSLLIYTPATVTNLVNLYGPAVVEICAPGNEWANQTQTNTLLNVLTNMGAVITNWNSYPIYTTLAAYVQPDNIANYPTNRQAYNSMVYLAAAQFNCLVDQWAEYWDSQMTNNTLAGLLNPAGQPHGHPTAQGFSSKARYELRNIWNNGQISTPAACIPLNLPLNTQQTSTSTTITNIFNGPIYQGFCNTAIRPATETISVKVTPASTGIAQFQISGWGGTNFYNACPAVTAGAFTNTWANIPILPGGTNTFLDLSGSGASCTVVQQTILY